LLEYLACLSRQFEETRSIWRGYTPQETRLCLVVAFLEAATVWDELVPEHSPQNYPAINHRQCPKSQFLNSAIRQLHGYDLHVLHTSKCCTSCREIGLAEISWKYLQLNTDFQISNQLRKNWKYLPDDWLTLVGLELIQKTVHSIGKSNLYLNKSYQPWACHQISPKQDDSTWPQCHISGRSKLGT
jgi:hypothetical protein